MEASFADSEDASYNVGPKRVARFAGFKISLFSFLHFFQGTTIQEYFLKIGRRFFENCLSYSGLSGVKRTHAEMLAPELVKFLSIYTDLSRDDLMERCIGNHTQNANESLRASGA